MKIIDKIKKWAEPTEWEKRQKYEEIYAQRFERKLTPSELKLCIEEQYKECLGETPNFDDPQTFNEKLAWIKLYYDNPLMGICADKVTAPEYYHKVMKNENSKLVPRLGLYKSGAEIDFKKLPRSFILKSNWGSGKQLIVNDKNDIDEEAVRREVDSWMVKEANHYYASFETGYRDIDPYIIAEELINFSYKLEFFCFNGEPKFFWIVVNDKTQQVQANFYDLDWNLLPIDNKYPNIYGPVEKSDLYQSMLAEAKKLCGDFPFVRCDFFVAPDRYYFSEMTFFHWGGLKHFNPKKYDLIFGKMLKLPQKDE